MHKVNEIWFLRIWACILIDSTTETEPKQTLPSHCRAWSTSTMLHCRIFREKLEWLDILLCMTSAREPSYSTHAASMQGLKFHPCLIIRATGSWLRCRCAQLLNRADTVCRCLRASREWACPQIMHRHRKYQQWKRHRSSLQRTSFSHLLPRSRRRPPHLKVFTPCAPLLFPRWMSPWSCLELEGFFTIELCLCFSVVYFWYYFPRRLR